MASSNDVDEYNDGPINRSVTRQRGYFHIFDLHTSFRLFREPHFYRKNALVYDRSSEKLLHRDVMFRLTEHAESDDRYISPFDGRIKRVVVQCVDDIYDNNNNHVTWRRTFIRNVSPFYMRLANWPTDHVDMTRFQPTGDEWVWIIVKWIPACAGLFCVLTFAQSAQGQERNGGKFDSFPYRFFGYPKVARNALEDATSKRTHREISDALNPIAKRLLRPRHLCFLRNPEVKHLQGMVPMDVEEWITQYRSERNLDYIFVAYTTEQFSHTSAEDMNALHQIAETAARAAGVAAYWIGCTCMPEAAKVHEDVYRISDVIRGAESLVIAVKRPTRDTGAIVTTHEMLEQWGSRIWTFPEVLLSPSGQTIKVYTWGGDLSQPMRLAKKQFAAKVWKRDSAVSRQLIDHFEGNCVLSHLELTTIALQCLYNRNTTQYLPGDHSYALMGLLRLRPTVDDTDSGFQAFARLSLANDSQKLMERLVGVMAKNPDQDWHCMDDAYGANLWDIEPSIQIAGIGDDDTVIVDGVRAANVRWKSFAIVRNLRRDSWKRIFARLAIRWAPLALFVGAWIVSFTSPPPSATASSSSTAGETGGILLAIGAILLVAGLILVLGAPKLLRVIYSGKFWLTQPWFFGFEGHMDIEGIERQIWGGRLQRLRWAPFGSPLSRHYRNELGECVGVDPCSDPNVRAKVERARHARCGEQRIFTLVDTNTMTVTLFESARPPIAVLLVGSEGGMQRAVGCSYDWTSGTLYKETVLRLETPCVDKMDLVSRIRLGLKRPFASTRGAGR
ncbi:hypothetical protein BDY21DRAFT_387942 [Lineolata rhizophorae]|uniref:3-hydroxyisobutyrate dehydrogenase protein n=1 Tax=Lineolata rhizophorae TaxID=578093 RepID=A0A6A6NR64_9PEZI|nr:hypothetical protein BDY21DRAFT_387942 [Lineolata rhizophorae]